MSDIDYIVKQLETLVNIPSPSGFTKQAIEYVENTAKELGFESSRLRKGGTVIYAPGKNPTPDRVIGLSAHVDTLGAMVRSINSNGTLRLTSIGGFMMESIESTYCKVHTRGGKTYTGTILTKAPAVHTFDDARTMERKEKNMEVRLDEIATKKDEVAALGIETGNRPECDVQIVISNYEEIGFGASFIPQEITEFVAVDMGAVGDDLAGEERKVSICAKDAGGAYDYELTGKLISIAKERKLDYVVDVFPHYSSDVTAALRGGNNICGALIGPGVQASHNIERTHRLGLENTLELLKGYLEV